MKSLTTLSLLCILIATPIFAKPHDEVLNATVIDLNFTWHEQSPLLSFNPPYKQALTNTHKQTDGMIPGMSFASDMTFFSGQHGAPTIDALGHIGHQGKLFDGTDAVANEGPGGLLAHGIESYPVEKYINRGVLIDIAKAKNVAALPAGYEITVADLKLALKTQGSKLKAGDSVLIRTGFGQYFDSQQSVYMGLRPGVGEEAALWLAKKKIFLAAMDTLTFDVYPEQGTTFPAHRILIAQNGIYIVENINLENIAKASNDKQKYHFPVVMNPVKIKGATGAPLNAFALF